VTTRTRCSSQHHAAADYSPGFLVGFHRPAIRVGNDIGFTRCHSLESYWCGRPGLLVSFGGQNAGASQFGNDKCQPHSRFDFPSPTPIVWTTRTVIPILKASLNIWNWRQVGGGDGRWGIKLCKLHIRGGRQKLVSRDIRANRGKLVARCVPIRGDGGSCWGCQGRVS